MGGKKGGKDADIYASPKLPKYGKGGGKDTPKDKKGTKDKKGKKGKKDKNDKYTAGGVVNIILKRYTATELLNALIIALGVVTDDKKKKKKKGKGKKTDGGGKKYDPAKGKKSGKDSKPGKKLGGIKKKVR